MPAFVLIRVLFLIVCCTLSGSAWAFLASPISLMFDPGVGVCRDFGYGDDIGTPPNNCTYGQTTQSGSFFSLDWENDGILQSTNRVPLTPHDGLRVFGSGGQSASGVHTGVPYGSQNGYQGPAGTENPGIDEPFYFFNATGMHFNLSDSLVPIPSGNDDGVFYLDMTGWRMRWYMDAVVMNLGSGSWGSNPEGQAILTCEDYCSPGTRFSLYYTARVPAGDPSNFGGVRYRFGNDPTLISQPITMTSLSLNGEDPGAPLQGTVISIASVPLPPTLLLFSIGLTTLLSFGRRTN